MASKTFTTPTGQCKLLKKVKCKHCLINLTFSPGIIMFTVSYKVFTILTRFYWFASGHHLHKWCTSSYLLLRLIRLFCFVWDKLMDKRNKCVEKLKDCAKESRRNYLSNLYKKILITPSFSIAFTNLHLFVVQIRSSRFFWKIKNCIILNKNYVVKSFRLQDLDTSYVCLCVGEKRVYDRFVCLYMYNES